MTFLERIVRVLPAYDHRDKGGGIHGVEIRFVLKGEAGAVQFVLYTGWSLPKTEDRFSYRHPAHDPIPGDIGYHSPTPMYGGQEARDDCPYLDGKPCYYDGSALVADLFFDILRREGSDGVWRELEVYYHVTFPTAQAASK